MLDKKWEMDEAGWVYQSDKDKTDRQVGVFTETVNAHNLKLNFA
jgi:hypothetical protein